MTEPVRPLEALKRYDLVLTGSGYYTSNEMERADDGEWVRFDELAALLQATAPPAPTAEPLQMLRDWAIAERDDWGERNADRYWQMNRVINEIQRYQAAPPERVSEGTE